MGKSSKEYETTESNVVKSLFSDSNPFRRKPESDSPPPPPQQPSSVKKRSENPNPIPASLSPGSKKRKKVENNDENVVVEVDSRQSRKRKRVTDDIEVRYEKKLYGEIPEKEEVVNVKVGEKRKLKDVEAMENEALKNDEEAGFDDEAKLSRTVFVGNLDIKTKKKVLIKEFEQFGEIESVRLRSVPIIEDKASRRGAILKGKINEVIGRMNAYIVFKNEQSAQEALSKNMSMMGENHIRVDKACPPRKRVKGDDSQLYERKKTVFVGNLPFDVKDEELYRLFCGPDQSETTVEAIRVVRDSKTSLGKGIAYILFKSRDAANTVVRRGGLKIRDRVLRLCHAAKADAMPAKKPQVDSRREDRRKRFGEMAKDRENASSSSNGERRKPSAASLPYQGVRASKSGTVKKSGSSSRPRAAAYSGNGNAAGRGTKRTSVRYEGKDRNAKRPAVAARKAKQLMMKRKLENGTPDNTHRNKKMRSR